MAARIIRNFLIGLAVVGLSAHAAAPAQLSANTAEVHDVVVVSSTVGYAATYGGGVWKTSDAGATWSKTSLSAKIVWKVAVSPANTNRLFVATGEGVWVSPDAGASWLQLTRDPTRAITVQPGSASGSEVLLAGVTGQGIYKSTNGGGTWARSSTGLNSTDALGLVYYPGSTTVAYAVLQCNVDSILTAQPNGDWGGVYRSADGGATWSLMTGLPHVDQATNPCANAIAANGTTVVVGIKDSNAQGCVYRVTSSAATAWSASTTSGACNPNGPPYGVEWIGPDFSNSNGYFIGSNQFGPWYSSDGGATFSQIYVGGTDPDFNALALAGGGFTGTTRVVAINGLGLFRTTATTGPWTLPTAPIKADRVTDVANHYLGAGATGITFYMSLRNGGVMKSTDGGASWSQFDSGLGTVYGNVTSNFVRDAQVIGVHPSNPNIAAVGMRAYGLYQTNGGASWLGVSGFTNSYDHKPQSILITPGGKVFYTLFDPGQATPGGLFQSTVSGNSIGSLASAVKPIFESNPGLGVAPGAWRVRSSKADPENLLYMMMYDSLPYYTANGGGTWQRVNVSMAANDAGGIQRLAFIDVSNSPTSPNTSTIVASTNRGIYRSTDWGANWSRVSATGLPQTALQAIAYLPNNALFGGDASGQLYCSTNDGTTWSAVTGGYLGSSIVEMKAFGNFVYVATDGGGLWKKDNVCP